MNNELGIVDIPGVIRYGLWQDGDERIGFQVYWQNEALINREDGEGLGETLTHYPSGIKGKGFYCGTWSFPELGRTFVALRGADSSNHERPHYLSTSRIDGTPAEYMAVVRATIQSWANSEPVRKVLGDAQAMTEQLSLFEY